LRQICPATLIVVYTTLRASVMSDIVELAQHGVRDVVIYGTDDSQSRFDELVERGNAAPLTSAVLSLLESNLGQLRPTLADAVREMFESPRTLGTVHQLAAAGGMTRRSLYRHLAAAGIRSPKLLVTAARIARAAQVLSHSRMTIREVARSLGFSKPEIMTLQFVSLIGHRPRELRKGDMLGSVPELIVSRLISTRPPQRAVGPIGSRRCNVKKPELRSSPRMPD
jgi:AraC-like DNA-binding protein